MTVEKSRPGLGTEPPHGAFLSPQSGKHVLVAQRTRGSASLVLQHPSHPLLCDFAARGPEAPGRPAAQPRRARPVPDRYPASASRQSGHKVALLRPGRLQHPQVGRPRPDLAGQGGQVAHRK